MDVTKESSDNTKVNLTLVGLDSNIFSILGAFRKQASRDGWDEKEIATVIDAAMASSCYNEALYIIQEHCVNGGAGPSEENDDEED